MLRFEDSDVEGVIYYSPIFRPFMVIEVADVNHSMFNTDLGDMFPKREYSIAVKRSTIDDELLLKQHIENLLAAKTVNGGFPWLALKLKYVVSKGITASNVVPAHHGHELKERYTGTRMRDRSAQYKDD